MIDSLPTKAELAATKPHGSRLRYIAGCKCVPCRAAASRYETHRALERLKGNGNGLVGTTHVRSHLMKLSLRGVGLKQVAKIARVSRTILSKIRQGERNNMRAQSAKRVLAVTAFDLAAAATVPAGRTWQRLNWLLEQGFTRQALARKLGSRAKVASLQIRRGHVLVRTACAVKRLFEYYQ